MRKTILTFAMMLMMVLSATARPVINATPTSKDAPVGKTQVEFKGDSIIVNDGKESVVVSGLPELKNVRDKINDALDDTLTTGSSSTVQIGDQELSPEDIKYMSDHWGEIVKQICYASIAGLLALVLLVLFFRFMNRRSKYRVIERAIENNYPLNDLSLSDVKRSAIYVQQPVVTPAPPVVPAPQMGQVPVGTPLEGTTPQQPMPQQPIVMTDMVNWRALMPAVKWLGWGALLLFCGAFMGWENPFTPVGMALIVVGVCKGFICYKEQKALQEAWKRAEERSQQEPMREGIPVPPNFDQDYKEDENTPYQSY